jgi:hypothetical protein
MIDLRKQHRGRGKHLGNTMDEVRKKLRPGDVLIGADYDAKTMMGAVKKDYNTYHGNINKILEGKKHNFSKREVSEYKKSIDRIPKILPKFIRSRMAAASHTTEYGSFDPVAFMSKVNNPSHSHAELVVTPNRWQFAGAGKLRDPAGKEAVIAKNKAHHKKLKSRLTMFSPHYTVLRPKNDSTNLLLQHYKKHGAKKTIAMMERKSGVYDEQMAIKSWAKDTLLPKLTSKERSYTAEELNKLKKCKGGICSTMPALMSNKTVGGKHALSVTPEDYLKSENYKVVGRIGKESPLSLKHKIILNAPKFALRAGIGLGAASAVYAGTKIVKHFTNKNAPMTKQSSYEFGILDELEKISNG